VKTSRITHTRIRLRRDHAEISHYSYVPEAHEGGATASEQDVVKDFDRVLATEPVSKVVIPFHDEVAIRRLPPIPDYSARLKHSQRFSGVIGIPSGHAENSTAAASPSSNPFPDTPQP